MNIRSLTLRHNVAAMEVNRNVPHSTELPSSLWGPKVCKCKEMGLRPGPICVDAKTFESEELKVAR